MIFLLLGLIGLAYFFFQQTHYFKKPPAAAATTTTTTTTTTAPTLPSVPDLEYVPSTGAGGFDQQAQQHEMQRVAHVVQFGADCYAKNSYGELLDIPADKCRFYSDHPSMLSGSRVNQREYMQTQQPQAFASPSATISPISTESTKNDLNQVKL
jgi:zona occludens toxin